jgi:2-methylcitrate dehydratase
MAPHSNAPATAAKQDYDYEIKDTAEYVHNYKVDSELAVSVMSSTSMEIDI